MVLKQTGPLAASAAPYFVFLTAASRVLFAIHLMFSEWQEGKDTFLTADNEEAVLPRAQEAVSMDLVLKVDYFRGCAMLMDLVLEADYLRDSVLGSPVATQRQALKAVARDRGVTGHLLRQVLPPPEREGDEHLRTPYYVANDMPGYS